MLVDLEVFYLGHLKNLYTIQYNTILLTRLRYLYKIYNRCIEHCQVSTVKVLLCEFELFIL